MRSKESRRSWNRVVIAMLLPILTVAIVFWFSDPTSMPTLPLLVLPPLVAFVSNLFLPTTTPLGRSLLVALPLPIAIMIMFRVIRGHYTSGMGTISQEDGPFLAVYLGLPVMLLTAFCALMGAGIRSSRI